MTRHEETIYKDVLQKYFTLGDANGSKITLHYESPETDNDRTLVLNLDDMFVTIEDLFIASMEHSFEEWDYDDTLLSDEEAVSFYYTAKAIGYEKIVNILLALGRCFCTEYEDKMKKLGWSVKHLEDNLVKIDNPYLPARLTLPEDVFLSLLIKQANDETLIGGLHFDEESGKQTIIMHAGYCPDYSLYIMEDLINALRECFAEKCLLAKKMVEHDGPFHSRIQHMLSREEAKSMADIFKDAR